MHNVQVRYGIHYAASDRTHRIKWAMKVLSSAAAGVGAASRILMFRVGPISQVKSLPDWLPNWLANYLQMLITCDGDLPAGPACRIRMHSANTPNLHSIG